jgi:membrane protein
MLYQRLVGPGKILLKKVSDDDIASLAAEMAYRFFLALFPFFIFVAAFAGFVTDAFNIENSTDRIVNTVGDTIPKDAAGVLRDQLDSILAGTNVGLLSLGVIGAIFAASGGIGTIMKGMNRVHDVQEERPIWRKYLLAIGLTVLAGAAIILAFLALVVGQAAGIDIAEKIGLSGPATTLFTFLRWPIAIVAIFLAVSFLYWATPNKHIALKWVLPGAILFTTVWLLATYSFGLYVSNFSSYNSTYGALGGVVILLIWFYLTSFIFLLGAEVNSVLEHELHERERSKQSPPEGKKQAQSPESTHPSQPHSRRRPMRSVLGMMMP